MRPRRRNSPTPPSAQESPKSQETFCYCKADRQLGELELNCATCKRWVHSACFKDLEEFYALPFMVSYVFTCHDCHPDKKENWGLKQTNFSHMCIMALANMTFEHYKARTSDPSNIARACQESMVKYFTLEGEIIPYFESNWENLTSLSRRVKNTWHQTVLRTLSKETDLFIADPNEETSFALKERDLLTIGPLHEAVKQLGKRSQPNQTPPAGTVTTPQGSEPGEKVEVEAEVGPKTRGASKRKTLESAAAPTLKKSKTASDFSSVQIEGLNSPVDFPFNREGYRYYLVEKDMTVPNRALFDSAEDPCTAKSIPSHFFRVVNNPVVTLSPNDRAHQLKLADDRLTLTGFEGYSVARATHGVSQGCWYYEVDFLAQPEGSHTRIGWAQPYAVLQACLGYTKFSYSWRSNKGTAFHDARGVHYADGGYRQGDTLGCLIELPQLSKESSGEDFTFSDFLPPSNKGLNLIDFKHNLFFEEKEEVPQALKKLKVLKGSRIEFFRNGRSCGTAFRDLYSGFYYPAVSIFRTATVRCNFGPKFKYPPAQMKSRVQVQPSSTVQPMSERGEQIHVEQCVADTLYMISEKEDIDKKNAEYFENA